MKILLISYYYSLSDSTGSLRARAMAKYLPQNGIEVTVLTYRAQNEAVSFADNIVGVRDITRDTVPLLFFYALRIWQKGLRWLGVYRGLCGYWRDAALKRADEIIERTKPDAILASYPVVEALEIGVALSEKYGLPLISDFQGFNHRIAGKYCVWFSAFNYFIRVFQCGITPIPAESPIDTKPPQPLLPNTQGVKK